ncbi:MAG: beta-propeller fold lactonase family protein, partial [Rhodospirillaceae bacterium]|nr:beta-propeller fold lactonase family protein [Rhodospirillaceae bacterium]
MNANAPTFRIRRPTGPACAVAVLSVVIGTVNVFAQDGTLLVVNRHADAGSVSFFDLDTESEIARVPIGPGWPHEVAVSPDGRLALTAEYGRETPGERLVIIDIPTARVMGRIDMGPGTKPHDLVFLPDNRHAVVTLETTDRLALVDVVNHEVVRTYPIGDGAREGHMVWLSPDGSRVYVGARLGQGTVSVVYLQEDRPPTVIPSGLGAEAITITPDEHAVWAINQDENTISIIDPDTLAIVEKFDAGTQPRRLANLPGGRMAVIYGNRETAGIHIYDVQTREVLD